MRKVGSLEIVPWRAVTRDYAFDVALLTETDSNLTRNRHVCDQSAHLVRFHYHHVEKLSDAVQFLRNLSDYDCVLLDACALPSRLLEEIVSFRLGVYPFYVAFCENDHAFIIEAFQCGVDAYLGKPFCPQLLYHLINALCNVTGIHGEDMVGLDYSGHCHKQEKSQSPRVSVTLDCGNQEVRIGNEVLSLTSLETRILGTLAQADGRYVTKQNLIVSAWGSDFCPETNVVEVRICTLRKKLGEHGLKDLIETRRGLGYKIKSRRETI